MKFVGVDLHKKTISLCVMMVVDGKRKVVARKRFVCGNTAGIRGFFEQQAPFQVVVEATANYEWFLLLVEDLADRCVLAHPKKLRVIAESKHKSDKIDAQILAEFLALDMIPEAYRPSPRIRQYRVLVRHRRWLQGRITSLKCKLRHKAAHYNADVAELFSAKGQDHLAQIAMGMADRFETENLLDQWLLCQQQLKRVVSYAGLDPGSRESAGKARQLKITKEGSRLLRWALVEAAWRLVNKYRRWHKVFAKLTKNTGSKKRAIVGVARRVLCVMFAMLRDGKAYELPGRAA